MNTRIKTDIKIQTTYLVDDKKFIKTTTTKEYIDYPKLKGTQRMRAKLPKILERKVYITQRIDEFGEGWKWY